MKSTSGSPTAAEAVYAEISYRLDVCCGGEVGGRERERERENASENLLRETFFLVKVYISESLQVALKMPPFCLFVSWSL
jgi:hypothetical protein